MCTRRINGNLEHELGLEQLGGLKKGEKIIFEFCGRIEERSRPCLQTVHRLYQFGAEFYMKTIKGDECRYVPKNGSLGDNAWDYPLIGTDREEAIPPHEIEKIVVTGWTF